MSPVRLHSSNPNLCAELVDFQPPVSRLTDSVEYASDYIKLQEEFCTIAQKGGQGGWYSPQQNLDWKIKIHANNPDPPASCLPVAVHSLLKSAFNTVAIEKEKIKQILSDQDQSDQSAQICSLRKSLSQVTGHLHTLPMLPLAFYRLLITELGCWSLRYFHICCAKCGMLSVMFNKREQ